MDKDENLLDNQNDEDDDLLDISLDDLDSDETQGTISETADEDIIDLLDLLEKGDDEDILGIDDETDLLSQVGTQTEELLSSDLELDDLLSDESETDNQSEALSDDDLDQLFSDDDNDFLAEAGPSTEELSPSALELDDLLTDSEMSPSDEESEKISADEDVVSGEAAQKDASADTIVEIDDADDLGISMEDLMDESSEPDRLDLSDDVKLDEPAQDDASDSLLGSLELGEGVADTILEQDNEIFGELDKELEESRASADDESGAELLSESEISDSEDQIDTADANFDEVDDIPLDGESLEELLAESDIEVTVKSDSDFKTPQDLTADVEDIAEISDEDTGEAADIPADEESSDDLFSEIDLSDETAGIESDSGDIEDVPADEILTDISDESAGILMDETAEDNISADDLTAMKDDESIPDEEGVIADDISDDITEEVVPEEEETLTLDEDEVAEDIPAAVPQLPLISEEKVEEIVRSVVGEVVEKVAREIFTEVAEKVISEAIDSLKKSLESDSE